MKTRTAIANGLADALGSRILAPPSDIPVVLLHGVFAISALITAAAIVANVALILDGFPPVTGTVAPSLWVALVAGAARDGIDEGHRKVDARRGLAR